MPGDELKIDLISAMLIFNILILMINSGPRSLNEDFAAQLAR